MTFPIKVAELALVNCGRSCCLCHKFCGTKMELHHIEPQSTGRDDTYENCMPLCFDCHAEVQHYNPNHPKGRRLGGTELRGHRDKWYEKVNATGALVANTDHLEIDRRLFAEIRRLLPSTGSIGFIREHSYAGSFHTDAHDQIREFRMRCKQPEFEFMDSDLESLRARLAEHIDAFEGAIGTNVFHTYRPGWYSVPDEWEYEQPTRHYDAVQEIHNAAENVCNTYDDLIRLGRRKLGVF